MYPLDTVLSAVNTLISLSFSNNLWDRYSYYLHFPTEETDITQLLIEVIYLVSSEALITPRQSDSRIHFDHYFFCSPQVRKPVTYLMLQYLLPQISKSPVVKNCLYTSWSSMFSLSFFLSFFKTWTCFYFFSSLNIFQIHWFPPVVNAMNLLPAFYISYLVYCNSFLTSVSIFCYFPWQSMIFIQ